MAPLGMALGTALVGQGVKAATGAMSPPKQQDPFNFGNFGSDLTASAALPDMPTYSPAQGAAMNKGVTGYQLGPTIQAAPPPSSGPGNYFSSIGKDMAGSALNMGLGALGGLFSAPKPQPIEFPNLLQTLQGGY